MRFATKKRLVRIGFIAFAIWPPIQMALCTGFDVSPWKLFAWGMYAVPQVEPSARVLELQDGRPIAFDMDRLPPALKIELRRFELHRLALGKLKPPDDIAREVLEEFPELEGVAILVSDKKLNRSSAIVEMQTETYAYFR